MGCPREVEIGDNLVFSVTTHTFATGAVTDADAVPAYRVYEDETGTAILTGNMAKLDDDNTTGFYSESIACTAANGFENGKTYTIYISAAVASVAGAISYGFKAYDVRKANLTHILGTLLTETAGYLAAAFKKFFNVETPVLTCESVNQTIDGSAIKTVTDKLDTVLEADGDVYRLTTNALEQAPSGSSSAPTAVEIRQEMDANSTQLAAILEDTGTTIPALINADSGAGAIAHTYTLTDSDDGNPIDGAEVWVTTDAAGVNVVASGTTNSSGVVTFMLDAGTYYFWRRRSGYNFVNPDVEIVSA